MKQKSGLTYTTWPNCKLSQTKNSFMLIGLDIIYWYRATFLQFYIYQLLKVVLSEIRSDGAKDHENKKVWVSNGQAHLRRVVLLMLWIISVVLLLSWKKREGKKKTTLTHQEKSRPCLEKHIWTNSPARVFMILV